MKKKIKSMIKKIIYPNKYSSEALCNYIRKKGGEIGENTFFFSPESVKIDINRIDYIKIGSHCKITGEVNIIAHDYSWEILRKAYNEILPSGGKNVIIGDNVFIGVKATILRGVTIGDNVIIGARLSNNKGYSIK